MFLFMVLSSLLPFLFSGSFEFLYPHHGISVVLDAPSNPVLLQVLTVNSLQ